VARYAGLVVGISAFLSLFVPALFFAASYTPITATFERRLPFSPAGWLIVVVSTVIILYIVIAVAETQLLARLPFSTKPYSYAMAVTTIALLLFAAFQQGRAYLTARLPMQAVLIIAFLCWLRPRSRCRWEPCGI